MTIICFAEFDISVIISCIGSKDASSERPLCWYVAIIMLEMIVNARNTQINIINAIPLVKPARQLDQVV